MPKVIGYFLLAQIIGSFVVMIIWIDPFTITWGLASMYRALSLMGR